MEALMKALNDIIASKNTDISLLKWKVESLEKENAELKKENAELKVDIEKYKENEAKLCQSASI